MLAEARRTSVLSLIVAALAIFILFSLTAAADEIHVDAGAAEGGDGSENSPFQTIGEGIQAAEDHDTIQVHQGTYGESILIDRPVTLLGDGARSTVIESDAGNIVLITHEDVTIQSISIVRLDIEDGRGIKAVDINDLFIKDVVIDAGSTGIDLDDCAEVSIIDTVISASSYGIYAKDIDEITLNGTEIRAATGLFLWDSNDLIIDSTEFEVIMPEGEEQPDDLACIDMRRIDTGFIQSSSFTGGAFGIFVYDASDLDIDGCTFNDHDDTAAYLEWAGGTNFMGSEISGSSDGVHLAYSGRSVITGSRFKDVDEAIELFQSSQTVISSNVLEGVETGIDCSRSNSVSVYDNSITGTAEEDVGRGISLVTSSMNIGSNTISDIEIGVKMAFSTISYFDSNVIHDTSRAIMADSLGGSVTDNELRDNEYGIWAEEISAMTMMGNELSSSTVGMEIGEIRSSVINDNSFTGMSRGIRTVSAIDATINDNRFQDIALGSIKISSGSTVTLDDNVFTSGGYGILITSVNGVSIDGASFSNIVHDKFDAIYIDKSIDLDISEIIIEERSDGIKIINSDQLDLDEITITVPEDQVIADSTGLAIIDSIGITVDEVHVKGYGTGILLEDVEAATITGAEIDGGSFGVSMTIGSSVKLSSAIIAESNYGVSSTSVDGLNIVKSTITGCNIGLDLATVTDIGINGNDIIDCTNTGVKIDRATAGAIGYNTITGSDGSGLEIWDGEGITLTGNVFRENDVGLRVDKGATLIDRNEFSGSGSAGIRLKYEADGCTISGNTITQNGDGIHIDGSDDHIITENIIHKNQVYGIRLEDGGGSVIHENAFLNNGNGTIAHAYDSGPTNKWRDVEGNYWSGRERSTDGGFADSVVYIDGPALAADFRPLSLIPDLKISDDVVAIALPDVGGDHTVFDFGTFTAYAGNDQELVWKDNGAIISTTRTFTHELAPGVHRLEVSLSGVRHRYASDTITFHVRAPDFQVVEGPVVTSGFVHFDEAETVITIVNAGDEEGAMTVRFYLDEAHRTHELHSIDRTLDAGEEATLGFTWNLDETGPHRIIYVIESDFEQHSQEGDSGYVWIFVEGIPPVEEPVVPDPESPSMVPVVIGGVAIFSAIAATEIGKYALLLLLFPLYSKLKKKDILKDKRMDICDYLLVNAGASLMEIKKGLNMKNGTLVYHLEVLKKEGFVHSIRNKGHRYFYLDRGKVASHWGESVAKFYPYPGENMNGEGSGERLRKSILRSIMGTPGLSQSQIARVVGVSRQLVNYHISELERSGEITVERTGYSTKCFVSSNLE